MQTPHGRRPSSINRTWKITSSWSLICDPICFQDQLAPISIQVKHVILKLGAEGIMAERIVGEIARVTSMASVHTNAESGSLTLLIRLFTLNSLSKVRSDHGWGYFIIERFHSKTDSILKNATWLIDTYIYQEGT